MENLKSKNLENLKSCNSLCIQYSAVVFMGVYFFEKSLSFLSRVQLVVFEILKLPPKYGKKLWYFPKKLVKNVRNEEKIQKMLKINQKLHN